MVADFTQKTKDLIDNLKGTCASYGLGNDGNESKIITQVFLYKFMNDKFGYDLKSIDDRFNVSESWEKVVADLPDATFAKAVLKLAPSTAKLKKEHLLSYLYNKQNTKNFSKLFDSTLIDISQSNASIFSVSTASNAKIVLFDELSQFISDPSQRDEFCRAIINQLVNFSFEEIFTQKFDFFATIFEYLIKDYNKDGGGKYAEYYTPHAVSKIMSKILVTTPASNVTVYDPSAGSGTLLMNVAHEIGEANCTIYSQDISQKSTGMLRLNLILNNLVHSIQNIVQGNTLEKPAFKEGGSLKKFDYIVSNPPFKLDFSESRDNLDTPANSERFFAGIPTVPNKKKDSMAIYLLFVQHIIFSLSPKGKAAIVVPTGFLTAENSIVSAIRKKIVEMEILTGVISMPSNIFATTGTNVSVLILDKKHIGKSALLMDATELGSVVKEGKAQKTVLSEADNQLIIDTFNKRQNVEHFAHLVDFEKIVSKNYSFSPSQYASSWDASTIARGTSQESLDLEISKTLKEYRELDIENLRLQKSLAKTLKDLGYDL
jgi:type I restriction enzyme M protein